MALRQVTSQEKSQTLAYPTNPRHQSKQMCASLLGNYMRRSRDSVTISVVSALKQRAGLVFGRYSVREALLGHILMEVFSTTLTKIDRLHYFAE